MAAPSGLIDAVGIDLEDDPALDQRLTSTVCRPDELPQRAQFAALGIDHAKLCFVAKEAVFKATFPRQRCALQFQQLRLSFQMRDLSFRVDIGSAAAQKLSQSPGVGRFLCAPGVLMAAFVIRRRA
jgi:4'-phosphopantetheinyl transferase EntD